LTPPAFTVWWGPSAQASPISGDHQPGMEHQDH
jgi:hypothetical protein